MSDKDSSADVQACAKILGEALENMRKVFLSVVNEKADISLLQEAIRQLDNARSLLNSAYNTGVIIGIGSYVIVPFPLTGDPEKDLNQIAIKLPEN